MRDREVIVIGAGFGGLSAAIELAAEGCRVRVVEAATGPGGKAGTVRCEGIEADTGPSLLTLPEVFDATLRRGGSSLEDEVDLLTPERGFRYLWPDGASLELSTRREESIERTAQTFGDHAADELRGFLDYAQGIWEAAAPHFVYGEAPSMGALFRPGALKAVSRIDPMRPMASAIRSRVRHPRLRDVFFRYATYNGSHPERAPATLACIAHVELGLGFHGVRGGIAALVRALVDVAERNGVQFQYDAPVERILLRRGRVSGVELRGGERLEAQAVVANADAAHVAADLLPREQGQKVVGEREPSTSGWTAIVRARRDPNRAAHTVAFPADYAQEFRDLFDRDRPPSDPTVYVCAQEPAHGRVGWAEDEALFLMVNAPAEPARGSRPEGWWEEVRGRALDRIRAAGLIGSEDRVVWERTPAALAHRFPGSRGSIYGGASNGRTAAFQRPANRVSNVPGLYLASGTAHPGGGMPLCVLSGRAAANALLKDRRASRTRVA